jgi:hypothetical protein
LFLGWRALLSSQARPEKRTFLRSSSQPTRTDMLSSIQQLSPIDSFCKCNIPLVVLSSSTYPSHRPRHRPYPPNHSHLLVVQVRQCSSRTELCSVRRRATSSINTCSRRHRSRAIWISRLYFCEHHRHTITWAAATGQDAKVRVLFTRVQPGRGSDVPSEADQTILPWITHLCDERRRG